MDSKKKHPQFNDIQPRFIEVRPGSPPWAVFEDFDKRRFAGKVPQHVCENPDSYLLSFTAEANPRFLNSYNIMGEVGVKKRPLSVGLLAKMMKIPENQVSTWLLELQQALPEGDSLAKDGMEVTRSRDLDPRYLKFHHRFHELILTHEYFYPQPIRRVLRQHLEPDLSMLEPEDQLQVWALALSEPHRLFFPSCLPHGLLRQLPAEAMEVLGEFFPQPSQRAMVRAHLRLTSMCEWERTSGLTEAQVRGSIDGAQLQALLDGGFWTRVTRAAHPAIYYQETRSLAIERELSQRISQLANLQPAINDAAIIRMAEIFRLKGGGMGLIFEQRVALTKLLHIGGFRLLTGSAGTGKSLVSLLAAANTARILGWAEGEQPTVAFLSFTAKTAFTQFRKLLQMPEIPLLPVETPPPIVTPGDVGMPDPEATPSEWSVLLDALRGKAMTDLEKLLDAHFTPPSEGDLAAWDAKWKKHLPPIGAALGQRGAAASNAGDEFDGGPVGSEQPELDVRIGDFPIHMAEGTKTRPEFVRSMMQRGYNALVRQVRINLAEIAHCDCLKTVKGGYRLKKQGCDDCVINTGASQQQTHGVHFSTMHYLIHKAHHDPQFRRRLEGLRVLYIDECNAPPELLLRVLRLCPGLCMLVMNGDPRQQGGSRPSIMDEAMRQAMDMGLLATQPTAQMLGASDILCQLVTNHRVRGLDGVKAHVDLAQGTRPESTPSFQVEEVSSQAAWDGAVRRAIHEGHLILAVHLKEVERINALMTGAHNRGIFAVGGRILFGRNTHFLGMRVHNGDLETIQGIYRVCFLSTDGRNCRLDYCEPQLSVAPAQWAETFILLRESRRLIPLSIFRSDDLMHGYAMTVARAQGSQAPKVTMVTPCLNGNGGGMNDDSAARRARQITRNDLFSGCTRYEECGRLIHGPDLPTQLERTRSNSISSLNLELIHQGEWSPYLARYISWVQGGGGKRPRGEPADEHGDDGDGKGPWASPGSKKPKLSHRPAYRPIQPKLSHRPAYRPIQPKPPCSTPVHDMGADREVPDEQNGEHD